MTDVTKTYRRTTYPTIDPATPANDQSGRTVLVVGASEGIGYSIAKSYAQANASKVILAARSQARLDDAVHKIQAQGVKGDVTSMILDSADISQIQGLWNRLQNDKTFVDVLVLSAARAGKTKSTAEVIDYFHVNVTCKLHMLEHFQNQKKIPGKETSRKILVDITSAAAHAYPYPMHGYGASKAAFSNYLCHLADEVPEEEMRMVTLHPGAVYTSAAQGSAEYSEDLPLWDHPSLSGSMGLWLSTPAAAFLHGRYIWANWDADELMAMKQKVLDDPGHLKVGITGVASTGIAQLMAKCNEFPSPKDRSWT